MVNPRTKCCTKNSYFASEANIELCYTAVATCLSFSYTKNSKMIQWDVTVDYSSALVHKYLDLALPIFRKIHSNALVRNILIFPGTYIHDLASHNTYLVCVKFIHEWWNLQSTPRDKFLRNFFMSILICSQSFCRKSATRKSPKEYFLSFVLLEMSDLRFETWPYVY